MIDGVPSVGTTRACIRVANGREARDLFSCRSGRYLVGDDGVVGEDGLCFLCVWIERAYTQGNRDPLATLHAR